MRILRLKIENLRKIEALEIEPSSNIIKVEGKNRQGKTTILDGIMFALGGSVIPEDVVKRDKEKSVIEVNLGDYKIKKVITKTNKFLTVETKEGHIIKSPQTFLNSLVGRIAFDPMSFMRMTDQEQATVLKRVLGIQDKIDEYKKNESDLIDERRLLFREIEKLKPFIPANIEKVEEPKDVTDLICEVNVLVDKKSKKQDDLSNKIMLLKGLEEKKELIRVMEKKLTFLKIDTEAIISRLKGFREEEDKIAIEFIETSINEKRSRMDKRAEDLNRYEKYQGYLQNKKEYETKFSNREKVNKKIDGIKEKMKVLLHSIKLPIEELELTDDGLLFNGYKFENLAESEKLEVSIAISMAMNPKLKVILIRDGSLLDNDSLKAIEKISLKEDYQIWIEKVTSEKDDEKAIFIYEGEIIS